MKYREVKGHAQDYTAMQMESLETAFGLLGWKVKVLLSYYTTTADIVPKTGDSFHDSIWFKSIYFNSMKQSSEALSFYWKIYPHSPLCILLGSEGRRVVPYLCKQYLNGAILQKV